ncbi:hypothetical protein ACSPAH_23065 [Buttiauxella agrestis]
MSGQNGATRRFERDFRVRGMATCRRSRMAVHLSKKRFSAPADTASISLSAAATGGAFLLAFHAVRA